MIQPRELRIGNAYIDICGSPNIWKQEYFEYYKSLLFGGSNGFERINPILISPGILIKCGLEKNGSVYNTTNFSGLFVQFTNQWHLKRNSNGKVTDITYGFKFLHQLQNLYFALTGEELNIQL